MNEEIEYIKFTNKELADRTLILAQLGYLDFYSNYIMLNGRDKKDILGMNKYAIRFYTLTKFDYEIFDKKLNIENSKIKNTDMIHEIMFKLQLNSDDKLKREEYVFINDFIARFMKVTGIGDNNREVNNPSKAILRNR